MLKILLFIYASILNSYICFAEARQTIGFVYVHESAPSSKAAETFKQQIEKRSKGTWTVEILKTSQALDKIKGQDSVANLNPQQKIDRLLTHEGFRILQIPVAGLQNSLPDLKILSLPYLFNNDHEVFASLDGPLGNYLKSKYTSKSIGHSILEFTYSGGFENLMSRDPDMNINNLKDYSLAVFPNAEFRADFLSPLFGNVKNEYYKINDPTLGKMAISVSASQVPFPKNRTDMFKSMIKLGAQVYLTAYVVDTKWLASLKSEEQDWILTSAREAAIVERNWAIQINTKIYKQIEKNSGKIYGFSTQQLDLLKTTGLKLRKDFVEHSGLDVIKFLTGPNVTIEKGQPSPGISN